MRQNRHEMGGVRQGAAQNRGVGAGEGGIGDHRCRSVPPEIRPMGLVGEGPGSAPPVPRHRPPPMTDQPVMMALGGPPSSSGASASALITSTEGPDERRPSGW